MYIAFFIIHKNFKFINEKYFTTIRTAILNCVNDTNHVHLYFNSERDVHKYDKYFKHSRFRLFHHTTPNYTNDIDMAKVCYDLSTKSGYDYHWIIKLRPDLLIFDPNIFTNLKTKYDSSFIHARCKFYVGPSNLKKHHKSNWEFYTHINHYKESLLIMDDQMYMIPYTLQYFAFTASSMNIDIPNNNNNLKNLKNIFVHSISIKDMEDTPEKKQTVLWNHFDIPLKINELFVVLMSDLRTYNMVNIV